MRSPRLVLVLLKALLALFGLELAPRPLRQPRFRPATPIPRELLRFGAPIQPAPSIGPVLTVPIPRGPPGSLRARDAFCRTVAWLEHHRSRLRGPLPPSSGRVAPDLFGHAPPLPIGRPRCAVALWLVCDAPPPRKATAA